MKSLLAWDAASSQLLGEVARRQIGVLPESATASNAAAQYGDYRLLRRLGRGGMGEVWLAERTDGLMKRLVALKFPHAGIQAWEFAQHSHRERDILASLAHPGIARLYDAGIDERGGPFLVLEFIEGVALDRYCDERQLQIRARLVLFLQVLEAVQYAHAHLVIHSDLKPSNILVTTDGEVKLLDFGIARLIRTEDAAGSELTLTGLPAMTPAYAAPEQLAGRRVTTGCDIYSLGVLLFELLSGSRPYSVNRNSSGAFEQESSTVVACRPSQAVLDVEKARARNSTPRRLAATLRGDLDNITVKATQWAPEKRYATVDAFKADLRRYLAGEAVLARSESAWYRGRKFIARHKIPVAAIAGIVVALAVGLSVALWQSHVARREAQTSAAVQQFIQDIFETNTRDQRDPVKAQHTTARELLDIGARKIDSNLSNAPAAKEKMLSILSNLYVDFGLDDRAVALAKKQVAVARQAFGPNDPRVAVALTSLGRILQSSSSVNEREAVLLDAKRILDRNHDWASLRRAALNDALTEHYQSSDRDKALEFGSQAIAIYRTLPPSDDLAGALYHEALIYGYNDENAHAEPLLAEAVSIAENRGGSLDPNLPLYASALGEANQSLMHFRDAEKSLQLAWKVAAKLNGEEHVDVIETEARLGMFYGSVSRYREGLQHLQHATDVCLKIKGPEDPFFTPQMFLQYGEVLSWSGRLEEGLAYISRAIENRRKNRPGTRYLAQMLSSQALLLANMHEDVAARRSLDEASSIARKVGFSNGSTFVETQVILAIGAHARDDAKLLIDSGLGPLTADGVLSWNSLRNLYWRSELALLNNDSATADSLASRGLKLVESGESADYLKRWEARFLLVRGNASCLRGEPSRALPPLQRALELAADIYDPSSPDMAVAEAYLALCYLDLGKRAETAKLLAQAESISRIHKQLAEHYTKPIRELRERLAR